MIIALILKAIGRNKMHTAMDTAYKLLQLAKAKDITLSNLQVQKLVYIAHGYVLGMTGKPLIEDEVQAWKYGPVIHSIYHQLKSYGKNKIPTDNIDKFIFDPEFSAKEIECLNGVLELFGKDDPESLINITHQENTPWSIAWNNRPRGELFTTIPNESIKDHYRAVITDPASVNGL